MPRAPFTQAEKEIIRAVSDIALTRVLRLAVIGLLLAWLISGFRDAFWIGADDTDGPGIRSNMEPLTDYGTCLQYLSGSRGGLTPRLDAEGRHMRAVDC